MKILHLTLKKKWFDMIASGEKKEEYREIKGYWLSRLVWTIGEKEDYSIVRFRHGYSKDAPTIDIECLGIKIGYGKISWGAIPNTEYIIIQLGKIINP